MTAVRPAYADLHLHSTCSDGRLAPARVVEVAARQGLRALALTDHDTVGGLPAAFAAGERWGVTVVAGIELTTTWEERTCHLLGYGFDPAAPALRAALAAARAAAADTVARGLAALAERGILMESPGTPGAPNAFASPTALLLAVVRQRRLRSRGDLFALLRAIRAGARPPVDAASAIAVLHAAGGVAVLAHPGRRARAGAFTPHDLERLAAAGLDGMEVGHRVHSTEQQAAYARLAETHGLVAVGGSDWHGRARDPVPGSHGATEADLLRLLARAHPAAAPGEHGGASLPPVL